MQDAGWLRVLVGSALASALALAACSAGEGHPASPGAPAGAAQLEVVARLVDVPKGLFVCGDTHLAAVLRYEIVSIQRGSYQGPILLAMYDCPLNGWTGIKEFHVGDVHRLELGTGKRPEGALVDPYGEPTLPRLVVTAAKPEAH